MPMSDPVPLSETEHQILRLVATGATNREIARDRGISEATVKKHLTNINAKLGTSNRTEAMRRALELGLVTVGVPSETPARPDLEAARRLATELERTRRRSRQLVVWFATTGVLLVVASLALAYAATRTLPGAGALATPGATAPPAIAWLPGINLPKPLSRAALAASPLDDSVYVLSGRADEGLTPDVLRYDGRALLWQVVTRKPTAVEAASAVVLRGEILVPGGCLEDGTATDIVEVYDPRRNSWRTVASLPAPVCAYGLVELDGYAILFGGREGEDAETARESIWRYDAGADKWLPEGELPLARCDLAATRAGSGVRLLGGRDRSGRVQASHWLYRPYDAPDARWDVDTQPPLPEGRAGLVAVSTPMGGVHVAGGGWDRRLDEGTLMLSRSGVWEQDAPLPGITPQRGAAMTLVDGRLAVLVGGEADGSLLDRQYRREVVFSYYFPSRPLR